MVFRAIDPWIMAEATRFKDLQEAQKRLDQIFQSESMKRDAAELKLQEQMSQISTDVQNQLQSFAGKFDHLSQTLATMQLQLLNGDKKKHAMSEGSILGERNSDGRDGYYQLKDSQSSGSKFTNDSSGMNVHNPLPKIDFPRFDGTNPRAWILKCQGYFNLIPNVPDHQRVVLASMHFEGRAAHWYQNISLKQVDFSWSQFLELISARFEDLRETKIIAEFNKLRLTGSYTDYVERFEELKSCMILLNRGDYSEEYFIASFISGLSDELQSFIRMFNPQTLDQTIELGKNQLLTIEALSRKMKSSAKPATSIHQNFKRADTNNNHQFKGASSPTTPFKLLTKAEMAVRKEKGLCYNCDEPFAPGHRCKQRVIYMLMTEEEEATLFNATVEKEEEENNYDTTKDLEEVQLAFSALSGEGSPTTMRLIGTTGAQNINILIDTGSTMSFLSEATATALGCSLETVKPLLIKVANGQKMISSKRVSGFQWNMQQHQFTYAPRILATEGCDLSLGGDWLKSCTPVELDYDKMTFTVTSKGKRVKIQAIAQVGHCQMISGSSLYQPFHQDYVDSIDEVYWIKCKENYDVAPTTLDSLFAEYQDIFAETKGLPPGRGVEHQILLKPGSVPKH